MKYELVLTGRFKKGLKAAKKRGLDRLFRHDGGPKSSESLDFSGIAQNRFCEISVG